MSKIPNDHIKVEYHRDSCLGGQYAGFTGYEMTVKHLPSGWAVTVPHGRSQVQMREKAIASLELLLEIDYPEVKDWSWFSEPRSGD